MKRATLLILLISFWATLTAMGKPPEGNIPTPETNFTATFIDDQDISTKCQHVSWEGKTLLAGWRGKGIVTIPFEKVKRVVLIGNVRDKKKDSQVTLKNGEVVAITFNAEARLYGMTSFGSYMITVKNLKEIIFE